MKKDHKQKQKGGVGILSPTVAGTGNHSTVMRIAGCLVERFGYTLSDCKKESERADVLANVQVKDRPRRDGVKKRLFLVPVLNKQAPNMIASIVNADQVSCFIALHALKAGRHLLRHSIPFAIILGGTDVNEFQRKSTDDRKRILACLRLARIVVAFSKPLAVLARQICPCIQKVVVIPQAVDAAALRKDASSFGSSEACMKNSSAHRHIFLLPASIRGVKDPFYLIPAFEKLSKLDRSIKLEIVGAPLDLKMVQELKEIVKNSCNIEYLGLVPRSTLLAMICRPECAAVLNSSKSEGMSGVLLETMSLGKCPVVVRGIKGNEAIVRHNVTGYIFTDNNDSFLDIAKAIVAMRSKKWNVQKTENGRENDPGGESATSLASIDSVLAQARQYTESFHSVEAEAQAYQSVIEELQTGL